jgi:VWFA-related protein
VKVAKGADGNCADMYVVKTSDSEMQNQLGCTCGRTLRFATPQYCVIVFFFLVCSWSARAQTPPANSISSGQTTTIKSEVRLVLVDVVVTQGQGEPVTGLQKKDFEVTEDGRPQTISFFEEHTGGNISRIALPAAPPDVYTNYPTIKTTDSINVLLLDSLNTQATDQAYLRPQMVKFLHSALTAPIGARVAIFTLGQRLRIVRGFTTDYAALLNSFADPKSGTEPKFESQLASPSRKASDLLACSGIRAPAGVAACKEFFAQEDSDRAADRVSITLREFQALARYLAQFPGRKNVMWVSGSFPLSFFPETNPRGVFRREYQSEIRRTADLLTADQVAVYPISATGLVVDDSTSADNYGKPLADGYSNRASEEIAMETLAQDTGGRAFYNTNGLGDAMTQAIINGSHYYTLTYTPTNNKTDGKYRRIELKALSGSYKLAYRRGYYAESPKEAPPDEPHVGNGDPLLPLVSFGMPDFAEILYKVRVAALLGAKNTDASKSSIRYGVDFAISPQDVKLESSPGGVRSGTIEVALIAYDYDGKVLNAITQKLPISIKPEVYPALLRVGLQLHEEIDLPKGDLYFQTGIYDLGASRAGTLGIPLTVTHTAAPAK